MKISIYSPPGTNTVPGVPTGLTATADGQTEIDLSWTAPTDNGGAAITGYQIEVSADAGANWSDLVDDTENTSTTYTHTGLAAGTTRHYRVSAINSVGTGTASSVANATTAAGTTATGGTLVSNLGQTTHLPNTWRDLNREVAQKFTTGDNESGYGLATIEYDFTIVPTSGSPAVSLWSVDADGRPSMKLADFTNPATVSTGHTVFTAPTGTVLTKQTTYAAVIGIWTGGRIKVTAANSEDSGAQSGWSMANTTLSKPTVTVWSATDGNVAVGDFALKMRFKGTLTGLSSDATLSALGLEDGDGTPIDLSPTFVSTTMSYTASVANDVDEITIIPAVNQTNATYEIQDSDGTALTDADSGTDDFQVDLDVGANTIKVEVTAQNTSTETYTVVVTRATDTTPPSPESAVVSTSGGTVTVTFDEDLDISVQFLPTAVVDAFTVTADGVELDIQGVAALTLKTDLAITLPTGTRIGQNQTVKLSYDKTVAGTDALEDAAGNEVASFTDFAVTNNSTVDTTPPSPESAVVLTVGSSVTVTFDEDLDISVQFLPTAVVDAFTVTADGVELDIQGVVALTLATDLAIRPPTGTTIYQNQTVKVSYDKAVAGTDALEDDAGNEVASFTDFAVTNNSTIPFPGATGNPEITGGPQVGQTLTAEKGTIADPDGTTKADADQAGYEYSYQWVRVDGSNNETDIGTDAETYTVVAADVGNTIKVEVSFTDDADNAEGPLTSAATAAVVVAAGACPSDTDWCTTLTVGFESLGGGFIKQYGFSNTIDDGTLSDSTITYGGETFTVLQMEIVDQAGTFSVRIALDDFLPRSSVFDLGGTMFTADEDSEQSLLGTYQWDLPTGFAWIEGQEVTVSVKFGNFPATGAPAISGTAQVGQTLTALKGTIADDDGTTKADADQAGYAYTHRWVRVDGGTETPIAGATGSTYTLVAADLGKTIKVEASFKDDGDTAEGPLTSAATAAVVAGVGVTVSKSALAVTEQDATGDTYTVVLNSQPTASVTVMVGGYAGTAVTPTPATLTFTTSGWGAPQTVTVTAGDDANTASETIPLTHSATSTDSDYDGITIAGVTVTVNDNDTGNSPPTFGATTANRSVAENTAAGQNVGGVLTATDSDLDALTYTLEGTDAASFALVTTSGSAQLRTRAGVTYNHEAKSSHTVVVKADDNNGGTATVTVRITVTDVSEPPGRTAAPSVSPTSGSDTSLDVSWTAPTNTGPAIDNYDLRYRQGTSGSFSNGPQNQTGTSASIGSLSPGTSYEVQVRATSAEGNGDWSPSGTGQTTADAPSETTVTFGASSYTAVEGGDAVTVAVELSAAPSATVTIPLTKAHQGGATAADYSGVPSSVTFTSGQTRRTFTVTATDDEDDDDGESVRLGFGALPSGFAPGARRTATVALVQDAGVSTWYVWFADSTHTVTEGGTARIALHLNAPWKPERNESLTVPLFDPQHQGGASAADYSGVPSSVTFPAGQTRASFTVRATDDSVDDDDESVLLQFRDLFPDDLEVGRYGPRYTTLHIDDNDGATATAVAVSFGAATYTAEEGGSAATVRLLLDQAPGRAVTIPLTTTNHGGATGADYTVPSSVTFGASDTRKNFTLTATDDAVDDDLESVTLGFGSLPSRVSAGSPSSAVVNLTDNDGGETTTMLTVNFGARAGTVGTVKEGSSFFLNFSLDKRPGRKLTIPLEYTYLDGATAADFTDLSPSVTFESNEKSAGVNIRPVDDYEVDRGEGLRVSYGTLPAGVQVGSWGGPTATFLVIDTDGLPGLSVADASVREPPNEHTTACLNFWVTLDRAVDYDVSVDYATVDGTAVAGQDYTALAGTLVFWESEREKKKRLCVQVLDDDVDESTENMTLVLLNPVGAYLSVATATGRITSAAGDRVPDGESEALARVAGLSVEAVAGVLFGEAELSAAQRAALDYLGNRNGVLDLGDLLSWRARCQRDDVRCGEPVSATDTGSPPPSPAVPAGKRSGPTPPRRRGGARAGRRAGADTRGTVERVGQRRAMRPGAAGGRGPSVRRRATGWIRALVLGLIVSALSCDVGDSPVQPDQPDPGALHVRLTVPPEARDIGAMLVVEGPGIDSLSAPGFELVQADAASSNRREAIIAGSLSTGPVLQVWVRDRRQLGHYRVELMQVAGDDYGLKDLTRYGILISR